MKKILVVFLGLIFSFCLHGQIINIVIPGNGADSSYYHLEKINDNEYWAGGKHGVLSRIDTLGNVTPINYPSSGLRILKIEKKGNYVYLATNDAVIYRYDIKQDSFIRREFPDFKNQCFYDLIVMDDGTVVVCGGNKAIVESKKRFPKGFIAVLDEDLTTIDVVWKSFRKFVWALVADKYGKVYATTFNGLNSKILSSTNYQDWKKHTKIRGLVYELAFFDNILCYSGARNFNINQNGILGRQGEKQTVLKKKGFQWSMAQLEGNLMSISSRGAIYISDKQTKEIREVKMPSSHALYDLKEISTNKYLIVGKGKCVYLVDFQKNEL